MVKDKDKRWDTNRILDEIKNYEENKKKKTISTNSVDLEVNKSEISNKFDLNDSE